MQKRRSDGFPLQPELHEINFNAVKITTELTKLEFPFMLIPVQISRDKQDLSTHTPLFNDPLENFSFIVVLRLVADLKASD